MFSKKLANANASVIAVTSSAATLLALLDTAAGSANSLETRNDAVDLIIEDGDVRMLMDGNTPTATKGILLKQGGIYSFRHVALNLIKLISVSGTNVAVGVQIGESPEDENSFAFMGSNEHRTAVITTATTTQVRTGPGVVHVISILGGTLGNVTVYDDVAGTSNPIIPTFTPAGAMSIVLDQKFTNGLKVVTAAATLINIGYR